MARRWMVFAVVMAAALGAAVWAQDGNQGGGGDRGGDRRENRGGGDGGGRRSPEEWRAMMAERMKEALKASDDEWKVLQPKIERVTTAGTQLRPMMGFGRRGGGGGPGFGGDQPETPVSKAATELRNALQNEGATEQELATKIAALREARKAAQAELEAARKELQEVLTPRQEAVLVMWNVIE